LSSFLGSYIIISIVCYFFTFSAFAFFFSPSSCCCSILFLFAAYHRIFFFNFFTFAPPSSSCFAAFFTSYIIRDFFPCVPSLVLDWRNPPSNCLCSPLRASFHSFSSPCTRGKHSTQLPCWRSSPAYRLTPDELYSFTYLWHSPSARIPHMSELDRRSLQSWF
jgi:hypothetical protein